MVRLRDRHCRGPGCRTDARFCDIDHTIAWEDGGKTTLGNLELLCRRDHTAKHRGGWSLSQEGHGRLHWSSRTGHCYTSDPDGSWTPHRAQRPEPPKPDPHAPPPF
ncbi:HNH endonuclease signature motif containing protein [Arthrobacter hankyongi]|uniref:HNH endonuclease signature motif containing protein n=1 Tax=Arthrobacter hankyongi TaxID=2904801 RepID=UPI0022AAD7A5|nr:HNH endonuclease signature motif containing protein [Arthrobacter hankyongi]